MRFRRTVLLAAVLLGLLALAVPAAAAPGRSPAPRPAKLSAPGWTMVRSFETQRGGRFHTGFMRPRRTTWYVALYSGGDFPAFTQVVKVTVRNQ